MNSTPFQYSSLVGSDECNKCANCCKTLSFWVVNTEDLLTRFNMLSEDLIKVRKTNLRNGDHNLLYVTIQSECQYLTMSDSSYSCLIWNNPEKPLMCRAYPSNQFINIKTNQTYGDNVRLQEILDIQKEYCPALKNKSIDDIKKDQEHIKLMIVSH